MEFGYTEPEAQFLYVVATHSGYFILRQYLNFTGALRGNVLRFARKILNNGHAAVSATTWDTARFTTFFLGLSTADREREPPQSPRSFVEYIRTRSYCSTSFLPS